MSYRKERGVFQVGQQHPCPLEALAGSVRDRVIVTNHATSALELFVTTHCAKDIPTNKRYDYGGCCRGVIL
jgi:hypothetical protein